MRFYLLIVRTNHKKAPLILTKVRFLTKIYHPNIDKLSRICLDILKDSGVQPSRSEQSCSEQSSKSSTRSSPGDEDVARLACFVSLHFLAMMLLCLFESKKKNKKKKRIRTFVVISYSEGVIILWSKNASSTNYLNTLLGMKLVMGDREAAVTLQEKQPSRKGRRV